MRFSRSTHLLFLSLEALKSIIRIGLPILVELIDLVNCYNFSNSNDLAHMVNFPTCSLLIMRSAIELALPVALLNFPVERSLPRSSVLSSSFYLPINFSLNGSVGLKKVLITLAKFVTNKIWHLSHYIKPSSYLVTASLSRRSVNKVSSNLQNDIG